MKNTVNISMKQALQFNRMLAQLRKISKAYMTPDQIKRHSEGKNNFGIEYNEELEMSYENIQNEAKQGCFKVSPIKFKTVKTILNDESY